MFPTDPVTHFHLPAMGWLVRRHYCLHSMATTGTALATALEGSSAAPQKGRAVQRQDCHVINRTHCMTPVCVGVAAPTDMTAAHEIRQSMNAGGLTGNE